MKFILKFKKAYHSLNLWVENYQYVIGLITALIIGLIIAEYF